MLCLTPSLHLTLLLCLSSISSSGPEATGHLTRPKPFASSGGSRAPEPSRAPDISLNPNLLRLIVSSGCSWARLDPHAWTRILSNRKLWRQLNACQRECQKDCQNICQKVSQNRRQIECQKECQSICQKECQIECQNIYMPYILPGDMSETMSEIVRIVCQGGDHSR